MDPSERGSSGADFVRLIEGWGRDSYSGHQSVHGDIDDIPIMRARMGKVYN